MESENNENFDEICVECEFYNKECTESDRKAVIAKHGKIVCANF